MCEPDNNEKELLLTEEGSEPTDNDARSIVKRPHAKIALAVLSALAVTAVVATQVNTTDGVSMATRFMDFKCGRVCRAKRALNEAAEKAAAKAKAKAEELKQKAEAKKAELAARAKALADEAEKKLREEAAKVQKAIDDANAEARRKAEAAARAIKAAALEAEAKAQALKEGAERAAREAVEKAEAVVRAAAEKLDDAAEKKLAEMKAPKGDCRTAVIENNIVRFGDYIYTTFGHDEVYLSPPKGWDMITYRDEDESRDARKVISSHDWEAEEVCFEPTDLNVLEKLLQSANAAGGIYAGAIALHAGAGGAALVGAGGLGLMYGAAAVAAGSAGPAALAGMAVVPAAGAILLGGAIAGGAVVAGAALIGGKIAKEQVGDRYVAACFKNNAVNWFEEQAKYRVTKSGAGEEQCGWTGKVLNKEWLGAGNWLAPGVGEGKGRKYLLRKKWIGEPIDIVQPNPDADPLDIDGEDQEEHIIIQPEEVHPINPLPPVDRRACDFDWTPGMHVTPPPGCALFSKEDIGWEHAKAAKITVVCGVKGIVADISEEKLKSLEIVDAKDFSELSYLAVGHEAEVTFFANGDFTGDKLVADYLSESFIHKKWHGHDEIVNDKVKSMRLESSFDMDSVPTCPKIHAGLTDQK